MRAGFVALGVPRLGFDAMPLGSGTVVVVEVDNEELAASSTINDANDGTEWYADVCVVVVDVVVDTVGLRVRPVPVCTVTNAPGVTSEGSYPMMAGPSI